MSYHNDAFLYLSGDKIAAERKNLSDEDEYKMFCKEIKDQLPCGRI